MRESTTKTKKLLEVIQEDFDWLDQELPNLSKWWLLQQLLEAFRASYEQDKEASIRNRVQGVAKEVKDKVTFDPNRV